LVAQIDQLAAPAQVVAGATDSNGQQMASDDGSETYGLGQSADVVEQFITERMSSLRGAQINLFSLSIGYSYLLNLPPGRGGLTPLLALNQTQPARRPGRRQYGNVSGELHLLRHLWPGGANAERGGQRGQDHRCQHRLQWAGSGSPAKLAV